MQSGGNGDSFEERVLDRINRRDDVLISNSVLIEVEASFPGWERLKSAGLLATMRSGAALHLRPSSPHAWWRTTDDIETLVIDAERPWLTRYFSKLKDADLDDLTIVP